MKNYFLFGFAFFMILTFSGIFVSAVCCERLADNGQWCQAATSEDQCDSDYSIRSDLQTCDTFTTCHGTCVNENTGECSQAAEMQCEESNGVWYEKAEEEIPLCQKGCCVAGEDAYFINAVQCKDLATQKNINTEFREDVTSRDACQALITSTKVGACVVSSPIKSACTIQTNKDCTEDNLENLAGELGNVGILSGIEVKFYEGLLCTAQGISDCAKSSTTECKNNKVYYKDTCGNFANVYDSNKYENRDYWTYIMSPYDPDTCTVSSGGSLTCGNCETTENTVCQSSRDANEGSPKYGDYVCGDLSCKYEGQTYQHGESWCAGVGGALEDIKINEETGEYSQESIDLLKDQDTYNTPGTRYFKLICSYGEVLVEECKEYRNSICVESEDSETKQAACTYNSWPRCAELTTKDDCEDPTELCKWIPGYIPTTNPSEMMVPEKDREQMQGACVPLIAPGFDFWNGNTQGSGICATASVQDAASFETNIWTSRENFAGFTKKTLANQCVNGCYTIPLYGSEFDMKSGEEKQYPEEISCSKPTAQCSLYDVLTEFYDESEFKLPMKISSVHLSERQGQYCSKDGDPDHWLTGGINNGNCKDGTCYDCTPGLGSEAKDERKERDYPIFLTHNEWLDSITERARSLGDCGYKPNLEGEYSDPETEIVTAIFQKLSQKGDVKKNVTAEQIIYKAKQDVSEESEVIESSVVPVSHGCSDSGGNCVIGEEYCSTSIIEDGDCPHQMVCCAVDDLTNEENGGTA